MIIEPCLVEGEGSMAKSIPLKRCTLEQTDRLLNQLYDKATIAASMQNPALYNQIMAYVGMVQDRLAGFEDGSIKDVAPKEKTFKGLRIMNDD